MTQQTPARTFATMEGDAVFARKRAGLVSAQIDDALALAKHLDRDRLHNIIRLLRSARNRVVVMLG
jgi:DNA-binding MurR/RpiR family transcriptional regulator